MRKLPIPYPLIEKLEDRPMVYCLLKRLPEETDQFLYGKYYPLFRNLFLYFYTDCLDEVELTNEIYLHIMEPRPPRNSSYLENFQFQCSLAWWMKKVSTHFCISKYKKHKKLTFFQLTDDMPVSEVSYLSATTGIEREDFEKFLSLMHNERYRKLVRLRYFEGLSPDEIIEETGEKRINYYRTIQRARAQLREVYFDEKN